MRIGIDLGGTKIEGLAIDADGRELARRRIPAPRGDYGKTLDAIVQLVGAIEREIGAEGSVGLGMPGTISPATGLVENANSTWLNGRPLVGDLPRLLGRPVRFANDANCFALSEATDGAAAGADVAIRCLRRATTSVPGRRATAVAAAASKRFCRDPRWRANTRMLEASDSKRI